MPKGFGGIGRRGGSGRGFGGGMGFGFRSATPPWPYIGPRRGGQPRCSYYFGGAEAPTPWPYRMQPFYNETPSATGYTPYSPQITREEELNYMKEQAEAIKGQLEEIDSRIHELESDQQKDK